MATWNTEATTAARDRSIMLTHVLPRWGAMQLTIDHITLQTWVTELGHKRSRATVAEALRPTGAVLRSAVLNRLIPFNPADDVRVPRARRHDTDERIISRADRRMPRGWSPLSVSTPSGGHRRAMSRSSPTRWRSPASDAVPQPDLAYVIGPRRDARGRGRHRR
jgi:hypothetical protein